MKRSPLLLSTLIAVPVVLVMLVGQGLLAPLDRQTDRLKYALRPGRHADTNIVVVSIDNDAIQTLGWPVRRNFYALMLHALAGLHPRAIGLDVLFEDPRLGYQEFPEYDTLLASMVREAGCVVLPSYCEQVGNVPDTAGQPLPSFVGYPRVHGGFPMGRGVHLPLPLFAEAAAGIGHVNFSDGRSDIPPLILEDGKAVPSFGLELFRVACGTARSDVFARDGIVLLDHEGKERWLPLSGDEPVTINYPGPLRTYVHYAFLDVLRSYDALRRGIAAPVPVTAFANKIILVGVIAEGRSDFRSTPADERMPSLLIHAAFVDNALHSSFLRTVPAVWTALLLIVVTLACSWVSFLPSRLLAVAGMLVLLGATVAASFLVFSFGGIQLPFVGIVMGGMVAGVVSLVMWRGADDGQLKTLAAEKEVILQQLHDREAKVALLEREIVERDRVSDAARNDQLLEEIRRYKAEIFSLASQVHDMEQCDPPAAEEERGEVFEGIVYNRSGAMRPVVEFVKKIAASNASVLVLGESGTGKELIARAIHALSTRHTGPFVAVNCSALAENLLESELFGHERGAFTGAVKDRLGRFELADGGTIFLDEIGDVSESFQLKLLRVLQEGEIEHVGGNKTIRVDVRVVAATNKELREETSKGRFREDLYYRLNVLTVSLPPLRDRRNDIGLLVQHFLHRENGTMGVSKGVMEIFLSHAWPGNVRELESVVRRAVLLARAEGREMITAKDLPEELALALRGNIPVHDQVLEQVRSKGFSRSAVTDTALELGGLSRGTVAEYLRGECLRIFVEKEFNFDEAVRHIALSGDKTTLDRVRKRLNEYLVNIASAVDPAQPWESSAAAMRSKTKNLPQRYHSYVDQVAEAFFRGRWKIE